MNLSWDHNGDQPVPYVTQIVIADDGYPSIQVLDKDASLRRLAEDVEAARGLLGDLIDALNDELRLEVSRSSHVIERIEEAATYLGGDYYGYVGTWL